MAVKVIVKRTIPGNKVNQLIPMIDQLRRMARTQSGYIYSETLRSADNPDEFIVVSNWHTLEHWRAWEASAQRHRMLGRIEKALNTDSEYQLYHHELCFAPMAAAVGA